MDKILINPEIFSNLTILIEYTERWGVNSINNSNLLNLLAFYVDLKYYKIFMSELSKEKFKEIEEEKKERIHYFKNIILN